MKTNAIIRIIIWSVVIVVLLGMLCVPFLLSRAETQLETEAVIIYREDAASVNASVVEDTNCYATPTAEAAVKGALSTGTIVEITRKETINGTDWAYITSPSVGWVPMACLSETGGNAETALATEPAMKPLDSGNALTFPADQVTDIEIDWAAGSILIQPADVEEIEVSESEVSDAKSAMLCQLKNNKLTIEFCEETVMNFIGINTTFSKDLRILVPRNWKCNCLEVDAASAALEVNDLTIREVEVDTASGACVFDMCAVDKLDLDTASGDVQFLGTLDILDCEAASANVRAVLGNVPSRMDLDSMSGDLDITLPVDAGFTARIDAMSSDFSSEFPTTQVNGNHVCGDGSCRINVSALSGDVIIRQAAAAVEHAHTEKCTTDPDACPDNAHIHTDACTTDPGSCPDNTEGTHHKEHN